MPLNFNSQGFLHQTITLTYEEFTHHFGTNPGRLKQLENALQFFRIFYACGCQCVYIDGSFASTKENPGDIDLCFDLNGVSAEKLEEIFPQFFDLNEVGRIRKNLLCHIFHFDDPDTKLFAYLQVDREGNLKGMVKLNLKYLPRL